MSRRKIDLGKSPAYYGFLKWGLAGVAGFIIVANAHFTIIGIGSLPEMSLWLARGIGVGMVIVESAVTTTIFSGDFQEAIIGMFDEDKDDDATAIGTVVNAAVKLVSLLGGLAIVCFLYSFDYTSTYEGLHGAGTPATTLTILTTLFLNFGNEAAAFLHPIIAHQHRKARISESKNRMNSEPQAIKAEHELRKAIAKVKNEVAQDVHNNGSGSGGW